MKRECATCMGLGLIPVLSPPMPCPDCRGRGYIEIEEDDEPELNACSCGCQNLQVYHTVLNGWQVYCPNCGEETEGDVDKTEAISWWNHLHSN